MRSAQCLQKWSSGSSGFAPRDCGLPLQGLHTNSFIKVLIVNSCHKYYLTENDHTVLVLINACDLQVVVITRYSIKGVNSNTHKKSKYTDD